MIEYGIEMTIAGPRPEVCGGINCNLAGNGHVGWARDESGIVRILINTLTLNTLIHASYSRISSTRYASLSAINCISR